MATISYKVFKHHKKEDGSYNVKIRFYHKNQERYIPTQIYVSQKDLTRSFKIQKGEVLYLVEQIIFQYKTKIQQIDAEKYSVDELIDFVRKPKAESIDFYDYTQKMIEAMTLQGRKSTASNYRIMLNSLRRFKNNDITFQMIDVSFLKAYEQHLRGAGTGGRGISLYLGLIRAVFNEAIREYNFKAEVIRSPFEAGRYKIPREDAPEKRSFNPEDICKIRDSCLFTRRGNLAIDVYMLSFYLIGMNAVDLYTCEKYENGRIEYFRQKTKSRRSDKAYFSVKVPEVAKEIIERHRDLTGRKVFSFYKKYSTADNFNYALRHGLNQIGQRVGLHIEFYSARHSWATIARNNLNIDKYTIHECLNHASSMSVTDGYISRDFSHVDKANEQVIEFIKNCSCCDGIGLLGSRPLWNLFLCHL